MLSRLLEWLAGSRDRSRTPKAAWLGQGAPGTSGLTPFQELCEAQLNVYLSSRGFALRDRTRVVGSNEDCVHGFLGNTNVEVWIYLDQVELRIPGGRHVNLESLDAPTPGELVDKFLVAVR